MGIKGSEPEERSAPETVQVTQSAALPRQETLLPTTDFEDSRFCSY